MARPKLPVLDPDLRGIRKAKVPVQAQAEEEMRTRGLGKKISLQGITITEAMTNPKWFGKMFKRETWAPWKTFLAALFGEPMTEEQQALYRQLTGRKTPTTEQAREAWMIVGRRGGKSRIAALIAVYLALFRSYEAYLSEGEVATIPVISETRKDARTVMRYIKGFLKHKTLKGMVVSPLTNSVEFNNRVMIEIHTSSFRSTRGYTVVAAICDEIAFWHTDESAANPDTEIIGALKPGMLTIPNSMLIALSSPYARRGSLWDNYDQHYGKDGDKVFVWKAPTLQMNPSADRTFIEEEREKDPKAAAAEYDAEFRDDVAGYLTPESVDGVIDPGVRERFPVPKQVYRAFVDPSGGASDSMTLAIGHKDAENKIVVDLVREARPPFQGGPKGVVADFVHWLRMYGCGSVVGDHYGGEWPREVFRDHCITYILADHTKSEYYVELLPQINSRTIKLLDNKRLRMQLLALERQTGRSGKDSIDHPKGGHDDVANAVAGMSAIVAKGPAWLNFDIATGPKLPEEEGFSDLHPYDQQMRVANPEVWRRPYNICGDCIQWVRRPLDRETPDNRDGIMGYCNYQLTQVRDKAASCPAYETKR